MELRRSWIVGLIEAAEKGNRKRQFEAASRAFSTRSNIFTIRHGFHLSSLDQLTERHAELRAIIYLTPPEGE
jgi:hypothetical protein